MIPASAVCAQPVAVESDWRRLWRDSVTDAGELLAMLDLGDLERLLPVADAGFALRVPRGFVARMHRGDRHDPLLLQVLPQLAETRQVPGFATDAVGDIAARSARGVLHKYHGRALLIASGTCAVNCRYCFRRHFPYAADIAAAAKWFDALEYLRADPSISEVILSGGDPLALATGKLAELSDAMASIPHLRRLRIHTRLPVVLPERVDTEFCAWLASVAQQTVVVIHANHANEMDAGVAAACARMRNAGATVLNQSVLLRGVNDSEDALCNLSEGLFACGVLPYYLHQLDRVAGTAHFEVEDARAIQLCEAMRSRLPGYLVPRLMREVAGAKSKLPVAEIGMEAGVAASNRVQTQVL